jgi:hypothetical protein
MKNPEFQHRLLCGIALAALSVTVLAQPPEISPNSNARMRTRPQVIYHLPASSDSAATLHSQAKAPGNDLPIDSGMPTSLQISRANANAAAARAQAQQPTLLAPTPSRRMRSTRQTIRSQTRPHSSLQSIKRENSRGDKSHRK